MSWRTVRENPPIPVDTQWTVPADVGAIVLLVALVDLVSIGGWFGTSVLRAIVGLSVLLFVPGYLFLAIVFPRRAPDDDAGGRRMWSNDSTLGTVSVPSTITLDWKERIALSLGVSVAVIPLLGFVVAPVTGSLSVGSVLLGFNGFVCAGALAAIVRRNNLPEAERLRLPRRWWWNAISMTIHDRRSRVDSALAVLLAVSMVAAVGTMGFVLFSPLNAETYTSTTLLTKNQDGGLEAAGYPSELARGTGTEMTLRVGNHEGVETTYTVVVVEERVETGGDSETVIERHRLLEEQRTVPAGGTWMFDHTVTPHLVGDSIRLSYYVYRGSAPATPSSSTAYRHLYYWLTVTPEA